MQVRRKLAHRDCATSRSCDCQETTYVENWKVSQSSQPRFQPRPPLARNTRLRGALTHRLPDPHPDPADKILLIFLFGSLDSLRSTNRGHSASDSPACSRALNHDLIWNLAETDGTNRESLTLLTSAQSGAGFLRPLRVDSESLTARGLK